VAVVVDSSLLIRLAVDDPLAPVISRLLTGWIQAGDPLHAPSLLRYEVANGLTRLVAARALPEERVAEAWHTVSAVPITYHQLADGGDRVVAIALRLGRTSAYDASYLFLAEELGAALWTCDGPLYRNATSIGFPVHLVS
jgi:predicted nucleic acid-binding protein